MNKDSHKSSVIFLCIFAHPVIRINVLQNMTLSGVGRFFCYF
jgi:hypothetical protein